MFCMFWENVVVCSVCCYLQMSLWLIAFTGVLVVLSCGGAWVLAQLFGMWYGCFVLFSHRLPCDYSAMVISVLPYVLLQVLCAALSPDERRLLLGCADNSLLLHNCARQMTHMIKIQMVC